MYRKKHLSLSVSAALGLTSFMMVPGYALAQDQQADEDSGEMLEEVIVTGSRLISEDGFGQTSPVAVVGMDDISSTGLTRIEEVLNSLPQIEASNNAFDSNGATGTASIDLRGLGANRTLVLLNGRRVQPGGINTESVDVNQIPTMMIERVEVLTGGASATYGADAVAGVVNFIMRRLDGVEFSAGISAYQHNNGNSYMQGLQDAADIEYKDGGTGFDGSSYNIEFAFGTDFADGRGNATVFATWRQNAGLLQSERDYSNCALTNSGTACGGSGNAVVPNFAIYPYDADGELDGANSVYMGLQPDGSLGGTTTYNYNPTNWYMRPQTQWTAGAFADFEINEHAVVYMETMFANNETDGQIAYSGTFFDEAYDLPVDNSLFPQAFQDSLTELFPGEDRLAIYIGKRNVEGRPRTDVLTYASSRIVAGIKGVINENWDYDVSFLHSQSNSSSTYLNDFYRPTLQIAVDGAKCAAVNCIPYEVFTYNGVTAEAANAMLGTAMASNRSQLDVFEAFVTGDTGWGLDAGNIMMAGGFNWLQTKYDSLSDTVYANGDLLGQGGPRPSVGGTVRAKELFAEANVPLLADRSWAQNMTLDLAYRWSDYNTTGSNSTYRVGIDWQITDPFRVRTGYNRAVRAPSVAELFSPQNLGLWSGADPCAGASPVPTEAECARTGVLPGQYGNISISPAGQYNALFGGNPNLGVEKAKTWTAGVVINAMDTMQISVDWWSIKIDDTISNVQSEVSLDECIAGSDELCANIHRGVGGSLWLGKSGFVDSITQNIGTQKWSGIDLAWAWSINENWNMDLIGVYTLEKETTPLPGNPQTAYDCKGVISSVCYPNPDWRHTFTGTYDSQGWWAATLRWRYFGKVDYEGTTDMIASDELGAQNYVDLNGIIRFADVHDVTFGVNNVFDKDPPMLGNTLSDNGNTQIGFYDALGRYFFADLTLRW